MQLIEVEPDTLIEMGQRMKQQAMDNAYPGQSVLIELTKDIVLVFKPEFEFLKPKPLMGASDG